MLKSSEKTQEVAIADVLNYRKLGTKEADFMEFISALTVNFAIDFGNTNSLDYQKAKLIFDECKLLDWTAVEFNKQLHKFIREQKFANFTVADFINYERPKLYSYEWFKFQSEKDTNAKFECYIIEGQRYYRFKADRYLPKLEQDTVFNQHYENIGKPKKKEPTPLG